jgi:integrase
VTVAAWKYLITRGELSFRHAHGPSTYDNFRNRVWTSATKAAGIALFDFHELRHTAAAFMIADGANALQVNRRMGHEDIRTTFNIYGHLFDDDEDSLVERLDRRARGAAQRRDVGNLLGMEEAKVIELSAKTTEEAL